MFKKTFIILFYLFIQSINAQTITGNFIIHKFKGIGGDGRLTEKAKIKDIYNYVYSDSKSKMVLTNPRGTQIDTIKKYDELYDYHYETVETVIAPSKSMYFKDFKNKLYEKNIVTDGKEVYEKINLPELIWSQINETKNIEGFLCRKATTIYTSNGYTLTYYAWYTDEIPIQDGPFLFVGLPGFIVELGVDDMFFIKLTNYEYNENQITIIDNIKD